MALFTLEEIKRAVFGSDKSKLSGANGFSLVCYQDNWDRLKGELEGVFKEFFDRDILNNSI